MIVQLDVESEDLIQQKVASGRYHDAAAVIREALDALEERERLQRLRNLVAEGFASAERGDLVELTPQLMEELIREGEEMDRLGQPLDPDVCP
jgi:putative addiction module CopG family antidote